MTEPDPTTEPQPTDGDGNPIPTPDAEPGPTPDPLDPPQTETAPDPGTPAPDASSEPAPAGAPADVPSVETSDTLEPPAVEPTPVKAGDIDPQSVTQLNAVPDSPLTTDAAGTTRIAGPADSSGWVPAPSESDPAEQDRIAKLQFELASRDKARLEGS